MCEAQANNLLSAEARGLPQQTRRLSSANANLWLLQLARPESTACSLDAAHLLKGDSLLGKCTALQLHGCFTALLKSHALHPVAGL